MSFALAAAGTGGHVYPALAVAGALEAAGVDRDAIVFVGGSRMEADTVPEAGYDFIEVDIRGLRRSFSAQNMKLPGLVRRATQRLAEVFRERKVDVVGVFGGYISVPAALAARRVGAAIVVHEQNARPGLANRLIAPRAASTLVAFPEAGRKLRGARVVGNPLREPLARFSRAEVREPARQGYGLPPGLPVLGVLGGSLGAQVLNEATVTIAADAEPGSFGIVHLTGPTHLEDLAPIAKQATLPWATRSYEPNMERFYGAADVVLARAGALTVSELMATGTPAVLVPLAATNQEANTRRLEAEGGAIVIPQDEMDRVPIELQQLLMDESRRDRMGRAALRLAEPDAAAKVAEVLMGAVVG